MRKPFLTPLALLCAAGLAAAQPPGKAAPPRGRPAAPPPAAAPADVKLDPQRDKLDAYLVRWQDAMKQVESLALRCDRTEDDKIYKTKTTFTGTIHFKKPMQFFWHMDQKDKKGNYERFVSTGQFIYQFIPASKEVRVYQAPKAGADGKVGQDTSLAFLFGMDAKEAKQRYDLKLHKEEKNYVYVDVIPKTDVDRADFKKARIILDNKTYLPRMLWFLQPNNNEVTWDLPTVQSNVRIDDKHFAAPKVPQGWKMVRGDQAQGRRDELQPRVVRPQK
jgi:TIGR03009 family protein